MTTGEWIVIAIFVVAVSCSISLFWWLSKLIRGHKDESTNINKQDSNNNEK